jgi:homocysteine S-methyltransferase
MPNIVAVGVNCTPPRFIAPLLRSLPGSAKHLLAYPNSGESWDADCRCWRSGVEAVPHWGEAARKWRDAGATLIGGCCRTTPDTIREIASAVLP